MRRSLIALGLAAFAATAAAGPSDTCTTLESSYHDEVNDLADLHTRPEIEPWPKADVFFVRAALYPLEIWTEAKKYHLATTVEPQEKKVAALFACGVERGCGWATNPTPEIEQRHARLDRESCDVW